MLEIVVWINILLKLDKINLFGNVFLICLSRKKFGVVYLILIIFLWLNSLLNCLIEIFIFVKFGIV